MVASFQCSKPAVLITDDDEACRETLGDALGSFGFETHLASTGSQAIKIVQLRVINIMVLDYQMPDMTGLQVLDALETLGILRPPCILVSGAMIDRLREEPAHREAFDFVPKPIDLDRIRRAVRRLISLID